MRNPEYPQQHLPRVFDTSFDYKTDTPSGNSDPDSDSKLLRWDHEMLWSKALPSGDIFAPKVTPRKSEYLIFTDAKKDRYCYGSDAITSSYTRWVKKKRPRSRALAEAIAGLTHDQKSVYLDPPYTIGSAMIWPLRTKDLPTMNTARGLRMSVADRMDLTLECVRRHYTGEPGSALADVTDAYKDFFEHSGVPTTTKDYATYRNATLQFIVGRGRRMAEWVTKHHPEIKVCNPWWQPTRPT